MVQAIKGCLCHVQLLQGQQVTSTLELDGLAHKVLLSDQQEWRSLPATLPAGQVKALPWHMRVQSSSTADLWPPTLCARCRLWSAIAC